MMIVLIGDVLNIILNFLFAFTFAMNVNGVALAIAIFQFISTV